MTTTQLAELIVDRLFRNGQGQIADRLVLELPGGKDGGGWGRKAVTDLIVHAITESRTGPIRIPRARWDGK